MYLKKIMEPHSLSFGSVYILIILEKEPSRDADVKQLTVSMVISDEVQTSLVTVPAPEEDSWISVLPPGMAEGALGR